jgi:hypothetical protein
MLIPMTLAAFLLDETCVLPEGAKLPDLLTVVPGQIGIHNQQQEEWLRFTNNIANLGAGPLWMEPGTGIDPETSETLAAYQVFSNGIHVPREAGPPASDLDAFLGRCEIGEFEFHPEHNHWHIAEVADYRICSAADFEAADSPGECAPFGDPADKVTFCLIDWTKIADNSATSDDTLSFWDCATGFQGISPGWGDQYHHSLPGQGLEVTDFPDGIYYLVSTANHDHVFFEDDVANNSSWVKFELSHEGQGKGGKAGNRKVTILADACDDDEYRERLESDVDEYIDSSDTELERDDFVDELCNGVATNR